MAERYQRSVEKSMKKCEVVGDRELAVEVPLPLVEVWEEHLPRESEERFLTFVRSR